MATPPSKLWYFAYGSNMSPAVLTNRRGIHPSRSLLVRCTEYALAFNVPGVPFLEPAMAGLRRIEMPRETSFIGRKRGNEDVKGRENEWPVHGIAYEISAKDLDKIVATEGGGVAYRIVGARAEILGRLGDREEGEGGDERGELDVVTLVARREAEWRRPSGRYLGLLTAAVRENRFPEGYCEMLEKTEIYQPSSSSRWFKLGQSMYLALWLRVQIFVQRAIINLRNEQGLVPIWFLALFDILVYAMWFHHDFLHAPLFGRGA